VITFVFHPSLLLQVPEDDYTIPLGQAEVLRQGSDVTVVGWGGQLRVLEKVYEGGREGGKEGWKSYFIHTTLFTYLPPFLFPSLPPGL